VAEPKTHEPALDERNDGCGKPVTVCGRYMQDVELCAFEERPSCKLCQRHGRHEPEHQ